LTLHIRYRLKQYGTFLVDQVNMTVENSKFVDNDVLYGDDEDIVSKHIRIVVFRITRLSTDERMTTFCQFYVLHLIATMFSEGNINSLEFRRNFNKQ
jgi:hypothetical protein